MEKTEKKIRKIVREILSEDYRFNNQRSFIPNNYVADTAANALSVIEKNDLTSNGGNEGSGKLKAKSLANKEQQTHSMVKRMKAYFDNNQSEVNKERSLGKNIHNSGIIQSWDLWGGDSGKRWANKVLSSHKDSEMRSKKVRRDNGGAGENKGNGIFSTKNLMNPNNNRIHK